MENRPDDHFYERDDFQVDFFANFAALALFIIADYDYDPESLLEEDNKRLKGVVEFVEPVKMVPTNPTEMVGYLPIHKPQLLRSCSGLLIRHARKTCLASRKRTAPETLTIGHH